MNVYSVHVRIYNVGHVCVHNVRKSFIPEETNKLNIHDVKVIV